MKLIGTNLVYLAMLVVAFSAVGETEEDWVTFYYLSPSPDRFVEEVMILSDTGVLGNDKLQQIIGTFLSRVIAANPDRVSNWMKQLEILPEKDTETLLYAVWLSATKESRAYLDQIGAEKALATVPPNVLALEPDNPGTLDMWWAYFFATGDEVPVKRIISALNLDEYVGAMEKYEASERSDADREAVLLESVFRSARWSLESNMQQHPRVAEITEELFWSGKLTQSERLWVGLALTQAFPQHYEMKKQEGGWKVERLN